MDRQLQGDFIPDIGNGGDPSSNLGQGVKIIVESKDTTHGIAMPDFGVSGLDFVEFIADKEGTFAFRCPTYCGEGHKEMSGTLIVEE